MLVEHRYVVAETLLGALAFGLALMLFLPEREDASAEQRERWVQSLIERDGPTPATEDAAGSTGPVVLNVAHASDEQQPPAALKTGFELARASMAVMAKQAALASVGGVSISVAERRLVVISETMPEIGPLAIPLPPASELLVELPDPKPVEEPDRADKDEELAFAVPLRVPPRRMAGHEWLRHAAVEPVEDGRPKIAIVIDDLGNNRRNTAALNHMPGPLTLAFLPYADDLARQTNAARAAGHELMLHMPMEPLGDEWPGPNALLISIAQEDFRARLHQNFESFSGFVGINNHMGSKLTADWASMDLIMQEVRRRDLLFLDSKTTHASIGTQVARKLGVPHAQRDVFLDNIPILEAVLRQLDAVEAIARRNGVAVAIGHPNDVTLEALRRWLPGLEQRGFSLVPVSSIVALRTCQREPQLAGCIATPEPVRVHVDRDRSQEG